MQLIFFYTNKIGYRHGHGGGGGLLNQIERATHMDLNGDGRIGGGVPHYNQYGAPGGYPPQYNQYGAPPCQPNYGPYGGPGYGPQYNQYGAAPCPPPYNQYGAPGYGPAPHQGGAGGGLINQLEKVTGMDLNGDGRIGGHGYGGQYNPYGRHY
ncbi:unnamed protein product [Adineta ricciae]|uniref:Uncharacterized protein n=1 Tax=Adineta ricciae TaxID=249248 RepID=A0A813SPC7_ADIRI|nr:unnamed protein product [Adineta ricciae]